MSGANSRNLLIKNVHIADALQSRYGSVEVVDGLIHRICESKDRDEDKIRDKIEDKMERVDTGDRLNVIDGRGLALLPGFIDLHCHLRDPGYPEKEDMESGQQAALKGGFTTLCTMANTQPVCDNRVVMDYIQRKAVRLDLCNIVQFSALTRGLDGEELVDFTKMREFTALFSDDGQTVNHPWIMEEALRLSRKFNFRIHTHSQPEEEIVARDLDILQRVGGRLHLCHLSQLETLKQVRKYRERGTRFSCEVTPHHLYAGNLNYRVNPPFGSESDRAALISGIKDGLIDIIATDHAPHTSQDKENGAPGISSLETAFSLVYTTFCQYGLDLQQLSKMMSYLPARLLGISTGLIQPGMRADLVLVNLKEEYQIDPGCFISKGKNTPFAGDIVRGRIKMTIKDGRILFHDIQEVVE